MNVLVTGANGQLGSEIQQIAQRTLLNFHFENSKRLDITNTLLVEDYIINNKITTVINCAAYTAVDKAEEDFNNANKVNAIGVENLVLALEKVKGRLIHISTDYVFNGENFMPYKEEEEVDPIGVYGITKRAGEVSMLKSDIEGIIIRTSWVYSSFGNNFVKTMLRLGNERESLGVISDQVGSPTYARDLAQVCVGFIEREKLDSKSKIYHYSNEGIASWYDFAKAIMLYGNLDCKINPIETKEYPTPAKRPSYSVMNKNKIKKDFNIEIPYWRDSLKECIEQIKNNK